MLGGGSTSIDLRGRVILGGWLQEGKYFWFAPKCVCERMREGGERVYVRVRVGEKKRMCVKRYDVRDVPAAIKSGPDVPLYAFDAMSSLTFSSKFSSDDTHSASG